MKVLFMTNILSFYRVDFFNELGKNCDLTVSYEADKVKDRNDRFYEFNNKHFKLKKIDNNFFKIVKLLKEPYDIIVIGTYATPISAIAIITLKLMRKKFIINADGGFINEKTKFQNMIKRFFISKANYWISSGKETNKYLEYYGAKKNKIFIYPFTSLFSKDILTQSVTRNEKNILRKKYNIPINKRIFITIGRFYYIKGNDIIINSVVENEYKNSQFIIISGGELWDEYSNIIKSNNIKNIKLIDYLDREELYDYLKMSDVLIMPSRSDVWGLVINEAMSVGLPIISSNKCIAGLELLSNDYIFDINENISIKQKIIEFEKMNDDQLSLIGNENIKKIKDYTIENMTKKHIEIFKGIKEEDDDNEK